MRAMIFFMTVVLEDSGTFGPNFLFFLDFSMKESLAVHGDFDSSGDDSYLVRNEADLSGRKIGGGVRFSLPISLT